MDYFLARYYSSAQGRFTSPDEFSGGPHESFYAGQLIPPDPILYAELTEPQSFNKYQYCLNNPLRYVDPDGHQTAAADALKAAWTAGAASEAVPGGQVVGTVILAGAAVGTVGYIAYTNWDSIKSGFKSFLNYASEHGGKSAAQQDAEDGRIAREGIQKKPPNPNGQQGAPDHQEEVQRQAEKAQAQAKPGQTVETGKRIKGVDSTRRPDVQTVGPDGKAVRVVEVERRPNSRRHREREKEYDRLKVPHETVPLDKKNN